jgi:Rod binding domain-containing protein
MAAILPATVQTTLPPDQVAKLAKTAQDFEANFIGQMLQPIFDTVDTAGGEFSGGQGEEQWKPMMVSELAKGIAAQGGFGIARDALAQMIRMQEQGGQAGAGGMRRGAR